MSSLGEVALAPIEKLEPIPNCDNIEMAYAWGCPGIVQKGVFKEGDLCVYIPPDFQLSTHPLIPAKLHGSRIKGMRLRGAFSMCLLLPNTPGFKEGDDIAAALGITKWERFSQAKGVSRPGGMSLGKTDEAPAPSGVVSSKYDLESLRRYHGMLELGEEVVFTEKVHGANGRFYHDGEKLHVGSRTRWLVENESSAWWQAAYKYDLVEKLAKIPGLMLYGEILGVKDLNYGFDKEVGFLAFDLFDPKTQKFLDYNILDDYTHFLQIPSVPMLYRGKWDGYDNHAKLAEGNTTVHNANHVREGFVVKPVRERYTHFGRLVFKLPGEGYLSRP